MDGSNLQIRSDKIDNVNCDLNNDPNYSFY